MAEVILIAFLVMQLKEKKKKYKETAGKKSPKNSHRSTYHRRVLLTKIASLLHHRPLLRFSPCCVCEIPGAMIILLLFSDI